MIPKDKAIELVNKYLELGKDFTRGVSMQEFSKECALIAVDEILNNGNLEPQLKRHIGNVEPYIIHLEYWFKVKHEINNL